MDNIGNRSSMLKIIIHDHINVDIVIFLVYPRLIIIIMLQEIF